MNKKSRIKRKLSYAVLNPVICSQCNLEASETGAFSASFSETQTVHNQLVVPHETKKSKKNFESTKVLSNVQGVQLHDIIGEMVPKNHSNKFIGNQKEKDCKSCVKDDQPTTGMIQRLCNKLCFTKSTISKTSVKKEFKKTQTKIACTLSGICQKPFVVEQSVQTVPEPGINVATGTSELSLYLKTIENLQDEEYRDDFLLRNCEMILSRSIQVSKVTSPQKSAVSMSEQVLQSIINGTVKNTLQTSPPLDSIKSNTSLENHISKLLEASVRKLLSDLSLGNICSDAEKQNLPQVLPSLTNVSLQSQHIFTVNENQESHASLTTFVSEVERSLSKQRLANMSSSNNRFTQELIDALLNRANFDKSNNSTNMEIESGNRENVDAAEKEGSTQLNLSDKSNDSKNMEICICKDKKLKRQNSLKKNTLKQKK